MEALGKKSVSCWRPICVYSYDGSETNRTLIFKEKGEAWQVVKVWIEGVKRKYGQWWESNLEIKEQGYHVTVKHKSTKKVMYVFQLDLFNLFL